MALQHWDDLYEFPILNTHHGHMAGASRSGKVNICHNFFLLFAGLRGSIAGGGFTFVKTLVKTMYNEDVFVKILINA